MYVYMSLLVAGVSVLQDNYVRTIE